ncbi:hypothetical protein A3B51_03225 [Candidatus Curtissbacteria bacterium RIFCSPLOWO2_01_FULL_41_18]|uniref:Peptidase M23 domain-containing protein n=1 Tax=Candidatus Curtissbacteria bacterium RIFCSPLOWO2_01_FULL_41_18 TaxID=1797727 RepID=A0A1F5HKY8_9BACT|nr:MAG: hypothetical protein A3B51_03225 [Candidatus Curtissbacteria bacterium RIFCSPLOWO2_01_FULL_41_18]
MKKFLIFLALFFLFFLFSPTFIRAVTLDDCEKNPGDNITDCIEVLSQKISELSNEKKTLTSQIAQFDTQIQLTQLKIRDAEATIDQLEKEINVLGFRIGYVTENIQKLEALVKKRIVATYQQSFVSNLELVLSSNDFSDLILRVQYLKEVQENDRRILASLNQTRSNYANQKDDREAKQAQIEENKKKLLGLKTSLDSQKSEKQAFLQVTKNDEARFQRLLQQALAERKAIVAAFSQAVSRLNSGEGDDVSEGSTIALLGNSGAPDCSSGPHLHFTVLKNSSPQDPAQYLKDVSPGWDNSPDGPFGFSGSWNWPISSPRITQGFGMSYWAKLGWYNGNIHDGIDMTGGSTISASRSGKLIYGSTTCGNSALKYAAIKHDDDPSIITLYLHIQ